MNRNLISALRKGLLNPLLSLISNLHIRGAGGGLYSLVLTCCAMIGSGQLVLGQQQQLELTNNFHSAILCTDGTVQTVGYNSFGQLGIGSTTPATTNLFATVPGLTDVQQVSVGGHHNLALKCNGTVWAWGYNNHGQVGVGSGSYTINSPTQVPGITNAIAVSAGRDHSMALLADGTILTWGDGNYGQLGNGTNSASNLPVAVLGITNATQILAASSHCLALLADGTIKSWGYNYFGQLGNGTNTNSNIPVSVLGLTNIDKICGSHNQSYAISNGIAWAWGTHALSGLLGVNNSNSPLQIPGFTNVLTIDGGEEFALALLQDGSLWAWGNNNYGVFGVCSPTLTFTPVLTATLPNIVDIQISATASHVIVILADGTVRTWGSNGSGQLGIGTTGSSQCTPQTPTNVCAAHTLGNTDLSCCLNNTTFNLPLNNGAVFYANYIPTVPNFGNIDTRAGFVVGNFPATATTINWNGTSNPFGVNNVWLNNDLVIPNNVTLTINNMNIHFAPHARILVLPGGRLRLGNNTSTTVQLTGLCNAMWQGIQVVGPGINGVTSTPRDITLRNFGIVDADNVQIKNALFGIAAEYVYLMNVNSINQTVLNTTPFNTPEMASFVPINWLSIGTLERKFTGGVVRTNNACTFTDCFEGINLSFYDNNALAAGTTAKCSVQSSLFESPLGLPYPFNTAPLNQLHSEAGVSLNVYANVEIGNDDTSTPPNSFSTQKYGIRANLAYFINLRRNNISACDAGISIRNSNTPINGLPAFGTANIRHNTLNNNRIGIQAFGANLEIIHNTIDGNFTNPAQPRIGLFIGGSQFAVSNNNNLPNGNTIINQLVGAFITSNETTINHLRNNQFQNCFLPIWTFGANGFANDTDPTGVNITCNEFDQYAVAIQTAQATNPIYGTNNRLNDQGDCLPINPHPADNTFFQTAVFDGILPDVSSSLPASAAYTYYYRAGTSFTPQAAGAVNTFLCNGAINSCQYPLLANSAIQQMTDTDPKNRAAIDKMYFYLHDENDSIRNIAAVVQLLESINTDAAKRLLLSYDLQQGNYDALAQRLSQLPEATLNQQYAKQLTTLSSQLKQSNRSLFELSNTEDALLHTIAASETQTAFDAQAILFVTKGEEYPLSLPALPDFCSPQMIESFTNFMVSFKTDHNKPYQFSKLYPNPNKGVACIDYALANNQQAILSIYNLNGQLMQQNTLTDKGTFTVCTNTWQPGMYYYTLQQADGSILQRDKIVVIR